MNRQQATDRIVADFGFIRDTAGHILDRADELRKRWEADPAGTPLTGVKTGPVRNGDAVTHAVFSCGGGEFEILHLSTCQVIRDQ